MEAAVESALKHILDAAVRRALYRFLETREQRRIGLDWPLFDLFNRPDWWCERTLWLKSRLRPVVLWKVRHAIRSGSSRWFGVPLSCSY